MLLVAGQRVVAAAAGGVAAGVHRLAGVVDLLVVLEVVLAAEGAPARVAGEGLGLRVDEDMALELELRGELLVAT